MPLNNNQRERYARHLSLSEIGEEGQEKLLKAKVLVIGAGGLGSPVAFYLAAAGIGTIGIMDGDKVDLSNPSARFSIPPTLSDKTRWPLQRRYLLPLTLR